MIKKLTLLIVASLFSQLAMAKVEIQTSYPLAVITAAYTWSDVGINSQALKEILFEKINGQPELKQTIKTGLEKLPRFCSGKDERNECHNSRELLVHMALNSKDLNELAKKMIGIWSLAHVNELMTAIQLFAPQYEKEIWQKNEKDFKRQIELMNKLVSKMNSDEFLNSMKAFYGSEWPLWLSNVIAVYPVPAKRGHTSGSSYGHFAEQAILLNENEAADVLAVSFHEMAHGYYRYQDKKTKTEWSALMAKFPMKDRYILEALLNEGLATILGNGISYKLMTGEMDKTSWYNDPFIEAFARANFELIQKKFTDKSPMTEKDFQLMVDNFKKASSDWESNPQFYSKTLVAYFSKSLKSDEVISYMRGKHMANSVYRFDKYEPMLKKMYNEAVTFYVFVRPGEKIPAPIAKLLPQRIESRNKPGLELLKVKDRWITIVWFNHLSDFRKLFP